MNSFPNKDIVNNEFLDLIKESAKKSQHKIDFLKKQGFSSDLLENLFLSQYNLNVNITVYPNDSLDLSILSNSKNPNVKFYFNLLNKTNNFLVVLHNFLLANIADNNPFIEQESLKNKKQNFLWFLFNPMSGVNNSQIFLGFKSEEKEKKNLDINIDQLNSDYYFCFGVMKNNDLIYLFIKNDKNLNEFNLYISNYSPFNFFKAFILNKETYYIFYLHKFLELIVDDIKFPLANFSIQIDSINNYCLMFFLVYLFYSKLYENFNKMSYVIFFMVFVINWLYQLSKEQSIFFEITLGIFIINIFYKNGWTLEISAATSLDLSKEIIKDIFYKKSLEYKPNYFANLL